MKFKTIKLIGSLISDLFHLKTRRRKVAAIILAAGSGTRMESDTTKQWLTVGGLPVVARTAIEFNNCADVKEIILCVKEDEKSLYADFAEKYGITKLKAITVGGETRQMSALAGFKKISDNITHIAVHDSARCLVTDKMISSVIKEASRHGSAIAACKSTDTTKIANSDQFVMDSPKRSTIWQAQTPQVFETEIYRASAYYALDSGVSVTDDSSMAEHAGFQVKLVDCGKENIKITEPIDIVIAEAILKDRENRVKG